MVNTLLAAIASPLNQVRNVAINQARRMMLELKKQFRYVASLKKNVLDVLNETGKLSLKQRETIVGLVDQFLTLNQGEEVLP